MSKRLRKINQHKAILTNNYSSHRQNTAKIPYFPIMDILNENLEDFNDILSEPDLIEKIRKNLLHEELSNYSDPYQDANLWIK